MSYKIETAPGVLRELKKIHKNTRKRLQSAIDKLADNPRPHSVERMKIGYYKLRVGDYRIIYDIKDDALLILVVKLGHRREVYKDL